MLPLDWRRAAAPETAGESTASLLSTRQFSATLTLRLHVVSLLLLLYADALLSYLLLGAAVLPAAAQQSL